jgi:hypothetical protein
MFRRSFVMRCGAVLLTCGAMCTTASYAATIPAWLDAGVTKWNDANPAAQLKFVNIKDSYVWYEMPKSPDHSLPQMRDRVNKVVLGQGYQPLDDEEMVTTGKPPVVSGRTSAKKCWSRSFVLNIQAQNDTTTVDGERSGQRQRMLTSMVCDDSATWWAAFRVAD